MMMLVLQNMMLATQYSDYTAHKKAHDEFLQILHRGNIDINYAKNW